MHDLELVPHPICRNCSSDLAHEQRNNKFCSRSCAASFNNKGVRRHGFEKKLCVVCSKRVNQGLSIFCSPECHVEQRYREKIAEWKSGEITGLTTTGVVIPAVKRYLREKYNNQCSVCGWSKINPHTGKVPLSADHVDGNWKNNSEDNLRLLCGCCDSLTSTYCGANKGNGRKHRR